MTRQVWIHVDKPRDMVDLDRAVCPGRFGQVRPYNPLNDHREMIVGELSDDDTGYEVELDETWAAQDSPEHARAKLVQSEIAGMVGRIAWLSHQWHVTHPAGPAPIAVAIPDSVPATRQEIDGGTVFGLPMILADVPRAELVTVWTP